MTPPRRPPVAACSPAVALVLLLAGCAADRSGSHPDSEPTTHRSDPGFSVPHELHFQDLDRRARAEIDHPVLSARTLPAPPGLDPRVVEPLDQTDPAAPAVAPLAPTLERLSRGELVEPDANPPVAPEAAARTAALRLYASGRSKLLAGDVGGAILDLESATRLDPTAGAPWRELGEAQFQQGKRLAATSSWRQCVRRGLREPRTLWLLGRDALRAGRATEAVRFLAAARAAEPQTADPVLPFLINADLADALAGLGCYGAAAEVLDAAVAIPDQFASPTRLRLEFGEFLRRRGDMLRDLGDQWCRLGRYDDAAAAYARASLSPSLDSGATVPRLVHVGLRRGRPSEAALTLLEHVRRSGGMPDERTITLVRFLTNRADVGPALADGIGEIRAAQPVPITPSVAGALTRARAAALSREKGAEALRAHLADYPEDSAALADLIELAEGADASALASELTLLLRRAPGAVDACADAALSAPGSADPLLDRLARQRDDSATVLRAMLLAKLGFRADAAALVIGRAWGPPFESAGPSCEVILASACGRYDAAEAAYARLRSLPHSDIRARARALMALQRADEALTALREGLDNPSGSDVARIDLLINAARLCMSLGRAEDAEAFLHRATLADPRDERPYAGLFRLHSPGGALADQAKLAETIRALRDAAPASRVLRLAAAQELADRRLDTQAEQLLLGLLDDQISDSQAGMLLTSLWDGRGVATPPGIPARTPDPATLARAETWLRARTATNPEVHWLWMSLSRVLWARGDAAAGEALLAERIATRPVDELQHARETILRDGLSRREEADAAALARLQPEPRPIGASIELVDLLVRMDRRGEALDVLQRAVPRTVTLTDDQQAGLGMMLARAGSKFVDKPMLADATVVGLFDEVAERNVLLPQQLHDLRIAMLALRVNDDPARVRAAIERAAAQHPSLASAFYGRAAGIYLQSEKTAKALPYLQLCVEKSAAPNPDLLFQLLRATVLVGEKSDLEWLIAHFDQPAQIESVLRPLRGEGAAPLPTDLAKLRAEFAYQIGGQFSILKRTELAHEAYRAALSFDPDHALTMNDYGYQILEEGGDLNEAGRLIEGAHRLLPDDANVTDSLAWVRYHQGIFLDQAGPPPRQGAISLLKEAAATDKGVINATILDHLGDASWAAGLKDDAVTAWKKSAEIADKDLARGRRDRYSKEAMDRISRELEQTRAKLSAVNAGTEPPIAKRRGT